MALPSPQYATPTGDVDPRILALNKLYSGALQQGFARYTPQGTRIYSEMSTEGAGNLILGAVDRIPGFVPWVGPRPYNDVVIRAIEVAPTQYVDSIKIPRPALLQDKTGAYAGIFQQMGALIAALPDKLLAQIMNAASGILTYDGVNFFDTEHPINPERPTQYGTEPNLYTSTPLTLENYVAVRASMKSLRGANGDIFGVRPKKLIVPNALEEVGRKIVESEQISQYLEGAASDGSTYGYGPNTNVMKGTAEVIAFDWLDQFSTTTWYLMDDTLAGLSPFIFAVNEPVTITPLIAKTDKPVFENNECVWGMDGFLTVGLGMWQAVSQCTA